MSKKEQKNEVKVDVAQMANESLAEKAFPGGRNVPFRVFLSAQVHADIARHAGESLEVEICGVLVGEWCKDERGPYLSAQHSIRGDAAENRMAEVTFTHNTWSKINAEMDSKYPKLSIVGWYHSHPDFGIFLSDRDMFIQEHFFNGPGQIAYVVDPVRKTEGVFVWSQGKSTLTPTYWVGDNIVQSTAVGEEQKGRRSQAPREAVAVAATPVVTAQPVSALDSFFSPSNIAWLLCLALVFVMGYMMASAKSAAEQSRMLDGVIIHFARYNVLRPGLRDVFDSFRNDVLIAGKEITELKKDHLARAGEEGKAFAERWEIAQKKLSQLAVQIPEWENLYCLPPAHEQTVVRATSEALNILQNLPKEFGDISRMLPPPKIPSEGAGKDPPQGVSGAKLPDAKPEALKSEPSKNGEEKLPAVKKEEVPPAKEPAAKKDEPTAPPKTVNK